MSTQSIQSDPDRWINQVIDNRYRITEHLGRGGMGSVFKVVHTKFGKVAALKLLHGNLAQDRELIKRFHREAEAISKLSHPNIVQVFDFGQVEETIYLVMEYLKGEDLSAIIKREGPIDVQRSTSILIQICDALTEAHDLSIIHRDLKPENVRVARTKAGQDFVKVMDFGLAKMLKEDETDPAITAKGNLVGTPYYMAPEMIRAQPLDHRCDIYSLGAMAYRMLTGENAFMANTPVGVLTKHITEDLTPPSHRSPDLEISPQMDRIVLRAMAKQPAQRYQTAGEMKQDLIDLLGISPPGQTPAHGVWQVPSSPRVPGPDEDGTDRLTISPDRLTVSQREQIGFMPTGRIADTPLAKEDLAFERNLRRSRLFKVLLAVPIMAGIAFLVYWFATGQGEILIAAQETEPNNLPSEASRILPDKPISGHLGRRVSAKESDRDWYSIQIKGTGPQSLQARVSGIPNMDITLDLYDGAGGRIAGADSAGQGGDEIISNRVVDPGGYFLLVREVWLVGVPPTENVTDAYSLEVHTKPHGPDWEIEPNDQPDLASEIRAGRSIRGFLGAVSDLDCVLVTGNSTGHLAGVISGIADVDLVLEITPSGADGPITIDEEAESAGERFDGIRIEPKSPVLIVVRRKSAAKTSRPKGLDLPYTLKVWERN